MAKHIENQNNNMLDFSGILKEKYLEYFCNDYQTENKVIMNEFVDDMVEVTEKASSSTLNDFIPTEILHSICERFSMPFSANNLREIISGEYINALNLVEVFTLLWYFSCRNILSFDESIYKSSSKDGIIGNLLSLLKSKRV